LRKDGVAERARLVSAFRGFLDGKNDFAAGGLSLLTSLVSRSESNPLQLRKREVQRWHRLDLLFRRTLQEPTGTV